MKKIACNIWPMRRLEEVAQIGAGNPAPQDKKFFECGKYPFIRTSDVGQVRFGEIETAADLLNEKGIRGLRLVPAGTILMPKSGASTFLNHRVITLRDAYVSSHLATITAKEGAAEPRYLLYALSRVTAQELLPENSYPSLNLSRIKSIELPIPSVEIQRQIVAVLDEAFEGLDRARVYVETNLEEARGFFLSILRDIFQNSSTKWENDLPADPVDSGSVAGAGKRSRSMTQTGGRNATLRAIPGPYSLSVLRPDDNPRQGWRWTALSNLARLESGHTPSRKHPEYWGGDIPWIGIKDARNRHGMTITETLENTNDLGIANSSARLLPEDTVCLSRTASVGYVTIMGREMATSQDFVNWICGPALLPEFLKFLLLSQGDDIRRFASGSVHQTIYFPEVKAFQICHPPLAVQNEICTFLNAAAHKCESLISAYEEKLAEIDELRQSLLQSAFAVN